MQPVNIKKIHQELLNWYKANARPLPWRENRDPYFVWISEVMLQQTQVEVVIPYYARWVEMFPSVDCVAQATEEHVLKLWEGLGYYSRARNIKKAADILIKDYGGSLPREQNALLALPGIGDYIAGAIASIAFGQAVPALEVNGVRVISRIFNFQEDVNKTKNKKILKKYLASIVVLGEAGNLNQAIMDIGSSICVNKNPLCNICPIRKECLALLFSTQNTLPKKKPKKPIPHVDVVAAVLANNSKVLITKRPVEKMLGGMWEFPGGKVEVGESREEALQRELFEELGVETEVFAPISKYEHAYTHFSVTVYTYHAEILSGKLQAIEVADFQWVRIEQLDDYPMGKVDRLISKDLQNKLA